MKKKGFILLCFIVVGLMVCGGTAFVNRHIAQLLERQLTECPLPPGTEILDSKAIVGRAQKDGNRLCYGAILVKTERSEEELTAHYAQYFENAEVALQESQMFSGWYYDYMFDAWEGGKCYRIGMSRKTFGLWGM